MFGGGKFAVGTICLKFSDLQGSLSIWVTKHLGHRLLGRHLYF